LVGVAHDYWNHVVSEEEWAEHHSTSDSCAVTEDSNDETEETEESYIACAVKPLVLLIEIVPICYFDVLDILHFSHHISGQAEHEGTKNYENALPGGLWKLNKWLSVL